MKVKTKWSSSISCGLLIRSDLYKVFVRSEAPTTWPRNSIRHWPLKRSNFLSLPVPSKRRCRRQTFALCWPIHGQGRNPWLSRFWIGDRLLFPLIAILKLKIKQNDFLIIMIMIHQYSLISMRPIYYFDTWAIIWHGIVCWFMVFPPCSSVCCDHKIVLHWYENNLLIMLHKSS